MHTLKMERWVEMLGTEEKNIKQHQSETEAQLGCFQFLIGHQRLSVIY